jgi:hypothetical protein
VSPAAKNGWPVSVASATGQRVLLESIGGFAGSEQTSPISYYTSDRNGKGWDAAPFALPPAGLTLSALGLARSSDLSEGLALFGSTSGRDEDIYIQSLPQGTPREIGPIYAPTALSAGEPLSSELSAPSASNDLGHVLFTILGPALTRPGAPDFLWREVGDSTVENTGPLDGGQGFASLYEYVGIGNSVPALVGVSKTGHLISQCGTSLGSYPGGAVSRFNSEELYNAISIDGSRTFFTAGAADEGPAQDPHHCTSSGEGDGPSADELFARTHGSETTAVSLPTTGAAGDCLACNEGEPTGEPDGSVGEGAVFQGASSDGSKAFFLTTWPLLRSDGDHTMDLYEYDFNAPPHEKIVQVSRGGAGDATSGQGAEVQGVARVSQDGSHVYFIAKGVLTGEPRGGGCISELNPAELTEEEVTREGRCRPKREADNLYVYDMVTGATGFIGTLLPADSGDWQQKDSRPVDATPDGRFLAFTSTADLTVDDTSKTGVQVFEYNAETEKMARVSIGQHGFNDNGNTVQYNAAIVHPAYTGTEDPAAQLTSISDDGTIVVFQSSDALTPEALGGLPNVYEYRNGAVSLLSDGQDRSLQLGAIPSTALVGMDGSGEDVFFTTADQLVPQDGDTQLDVYDARVNGGFAPLSTLAACESEGCQGGLAQAPVFSAPASTSQPAGEEVVETSAPKATRSKANAKKVPVKHRRKAKPRKKARKAGAGHPRRHAKTVGRRARRR